MEPDEIRRRLRSRGTPDRLRAVALPRLSGDPLRATVLAQAPLRSAQAQALLGALARSEREPFRRAALDAMPPEV